MTVPINDISLKLVTGGFTTASKEVIALTANLKKLQKAVKGSATALSTKDAALKSAGRKLEKYEKQLGAATKRNAALKDQVNELSGKTGRGGFLGLGQSLVETTKKIALWTISTGILFGTIRAFKSSIETIKEHDSSLINLRKVYSGVDSDLVEIRKDVLETAKAMKSLNQEAFDAAVTVARTGRVRLDVIRLTSAALIAQNIAELEVTDSVRFLNSALIQFKLDTTQAIRVLDQWNELSNKTPAETKHLAQAVSVAGSVFKQAGADIQFLNANTAALVEITAKSGNVVGRAERTMAIFAQRQKTVALLAQIGIDVFDKQTQRFMTIDSLLTRVAAEWGNMTDKMKAAVAQSIAGTRQQQFFVALMENQDLVMENLIIQWNSFGSAVRENEIFLQSIAKEFDGLINAMERLAIGAGDAGLAKIIKGQIKLLTDFINSLQSASGAMLLLASSSAILGGTMIKTGTSVTALTANLAKMGKVLFKFAAWFAAIEVGILIFNKLTTAGNEWLQVQNKLNVALEEQNKILTRQTSERNRLQSIVKHLKNLKTARDELIKTGKSTNQVDDQALRMLKALKDIYPDLTEGINTLNQAYETFNATLAIQARLVAEQKVSNLANQIKILEGSLDKLDAKGKQPVITTVGRIVGGIIPQTSTIGGLSEKQKADQIKLQNQKKDLEGQLAIAKIELASVGAGGPGGVPAVGVPPSDEERNIERRIELLRERQRIIQMTLDGISQQEIVLSNIAVLEEKSKTLVEGSLEFERNKLGLLQNQLKLTQLQNAEAQKFQNIFSRGLGNIIASSLDSDDVKNATRNFVNSLGNELASTISKSVTTSLKGDIASDALRGIIGGLAGGLVAGGISLISQAIFGKEDKADKQTDALEDNTIEIRALNSTIRDLTSIVFGAPAGFAVPNRSRGNFGAGGVEASVAGGSAQSITSIDARSLTLSPGAIQVTQQPGQSGADLAAQVSGNILNEFNDGGISEPSF